MPFAPAVLWTAGAVYYIYLPLKGIERPQTLLKGPWTLGGKKKVGYNLSVNRLTGRIIAFC